MKFLVTLFTTILVVCGKVNYSNLSRYSDLNEKTYRRQYEQTFDFIGFNLSLVEAVSEPGQRLLGVLDSSFAKVARQHSDWTGTTTVARVALRKD